MSEPVIVQRFKQSVGLSANSWLARQFPNQSFVGRIKYVHIILLQSMKCSDRKTATSVDALLMLLYGLMSVDFQK